MKDHARSLLKGVQFHEVLAMKWCEAGIQNGTRQMKGSDPQMDGISLSLKRSPLPTVKQLLYLEENNHKPERCQTDTVEITIQFLIHAWALSE